MFRMGSYAGFANPKPNRHPGFSILRHYNQLHARHAAAVQHAADTEDPRGYVLEIHHRDPTVPKVHAQDLADTAAIVKHLQGEVHKRHFAAGGSHKDLPTVTLHDIQVVKPSGKAGAVDEFGGYTVHGHDIPMRTAKQAGYVHMVHGVQQAMAKVGETHRRLAAIAGTYRGKSQAHDGMALGLGDDPALHAYPHYHNDGGPTSSKKHLRNVHASQFRFSSKADAWRAMTALGHAPEVHDIHVVDSDGTEVLNLLDRPSRKAFGESLEEAYRTAGGRFARLDQAGGARWVEDIPKSVRAAVEEMGGKVRRSGAGLACVFRTDEAAKAAHAKLVEAGHRVSPHDIPGVLLVTFVRETPVHENLDPYDPAHVAAHSSTPYGWWVHPETKQVVPVAFQAHQETVVDHPEVFGKPRKNSDAYAHAGRRGWVRVANHVDRFGKVTGRGYSTYGGLDAVADAHKILVQHGFREEPGSAYVMHFTPKGYYDRDEDYGTHAEMMAAARDPEAHLRKQMRKGPNVVRDEPADDKGFSAYEAGGLRRIEGNPNQKDALDIARQLGASVDDVRRTGEVRVHHPSWPNGVTINSRRKDTPRELIKRLNQLISSKRVNEDEEADDIEAARKLAKLAKVPGGKELADQLNTARAAKFKRAAAKAAAGQPGQVRFHPARFRKATVLDKLAKIVPVGVRRKLFGKPSEIVHEERSDEDFHMVVDGQDEALKSGQAMADRISAPVVVVACYDDLAEDEDPDYMVLPADQWEDPDEEDPEDYTLVAVLSPGGSPPASDGVSEAVASRRRLAARMSAARIRRRPLGGKRLRAARRAKAWRRANPGKTRRKRMHTVYRVKPPLTPSLSR